MARKGQAKDSAHAIGRLRDKHASVAASVAICVYNMAFVVRIAQDLRRFDVR